MRALVAMEFDTVSNFLAEACHAAVAHLVETPWLADRAGLAVASGVAEMDSACEGGRSLSQNLGRLDRETPSHVEHYLGQAAAFQ